MGILVHPLLRLGNANILQEPDCLGLGFLLTHFPVVQQVLHDLLSNGHGGVQGRQCILEDDRRLTAPIAAELLFAHGKHVFAVEGNGASLTDFAGGLNQPQNALSGNGLAAAGLSYQRNGLLIADVEIYPAHRLHIALVGMIADLQVLNFK